MQDIVLTRTRGWRRRRGVGASHPSPPRNTTSRGCSSGLLWFHLRASQDDYTSRRARLGLGHASEQGCRTRTQHAAPHRYRIVRCAHTRRLQQAFAVLCGCVDTAYPSGNQCGLFFKLGLRGPECATGAACRGVVRTHTHSHAPRTPVRETRLQVHVVKDTVILPPQCRGRGHGGRCHTRARGVQRPPPDPTR